MEIEETIYSVRSSAEAEYSSLASLASELSSVTTLLCDFGITLDTSLVYCDNQVAIHVAPNPMFHDHTKQIKIDYHFIREKV